MYEAFVGLSTHTINDGLMALFFLLIGMELKRELVSGELAGFKKAVLPVAGAAGGVMLPALIFLSLNHGAPEVRGWAIPTATDIAFSLGVLALLGPRVPPALKIFLMAVAVIDDLIAVAIIALFYASELDSLMLLLALGVCAGLALLNRKGITRLAVYLLSGAVLWFFTLHSGVHATLAGVALGLVIPLRASKRLEETLHPWVAFGIVPLFAFANAGMPLSGISLSGFLEPLPLGILLGLFLGKQLGIFAFSWLLIRLGVAAKPQGVTWMAFYGACMVAGIGFTMSLFIGALAFPSSNPSMIATRLGVLTGSLFSGLSGYIVLAIALNRRARA